MNNPFEDNDRQVIPIWRDSHTAVVRRELRPLAIRKEEFIYGMEFLENRLNDWINNRSLFFAGDLVGSAILFSKPEVAEDAARYILKPGSQASEISKVMAKKVLRINDEQEENREELAQRTIIHRRLHLLRSLLHRYPRNPIAWGDLSYLYGTLGMMDRSEKYMRIALAQSPDSRLLLRSAARLYFHIGDPEHSLFVIRKSGLLESDPWIMAAEIAITDKISKSSKYLKRGKRIINSNKFTNFQVSELTSALATIEAKHGKYSDSRKLFKKSLLEPTENSIAQAGWAATVKNIIVLNDEAYNRLSACEAQMFNFLYRAKWQEAFDASLSWQRDQPLSTDSFIWGSYIASVIREDLSETKKIVNQGLIISPDSWILRNNLVFALASHDKIKEAEEEFKKLRKLKGVREKSGTLNATEGLISFRKGNVEAGRLSYKTAIDIFKRQKKHYSQTIAAIYWAREESLSNGEEKIAALELAKKFSRDEKAPHIPLMIDRVEKLYSKDTK